VLLCVHTSSVDEIQAAEAHLSGALANNAVIVFVASTPKFSPASVTQDPPEWGMFCRCKNVITGPSKEKPAL
jgi:hypothetical protein